MLDWPVAMSVGCLIGGGRPSPLWVALFPRQEVLIVQSGGFWHQMYEVRI